MTTVAFGVFLACEERYYRGAFIDKAMVAAGAQVDDCLIGGSRDYVFLGAGRF
jgi:hypothetical protein